MDLFVVVLAAVLGYLCGAISFARLVARIVAPREDLDQTEVKLEGSGEKMVMRAVSATSVSMHLGPKFGFATVVLDMLKVFIPTLAFRLLYPESHYFLITATTGMIGHIWPVYYRFKGGRGLSAVYGGMFAIDWIGVFATSIGGMFLGLFVLRDMLAAYMGGLWLLIPWLWLRSQDAAYVIYAIVVNVIFLLAMLPEMRQYIQLRREGKGEDLTEVMQLTGMGRGIYKMAKRFGVIDVNEQ
ncbi:MAG: glycerol-3-phosphate acyltransferase [Anaerolineae bacterium]